MTNQADNCNDMDSYDLRNEKNIENKIDNKYYLRLLKEDKRVKLLGLDYDVFHHFQECIFNSTKNSNGEVDYQRYLDMVAQSITNQTKLKNYNNRKY